MAGVIDQPHEALGYEQIVDLSTAVGLTVPRGAKFALIQAEGANVRWRDDGTAPTATVGMLLSTTSDGLWFTGDLRAVRFIQTTAGAKLNVSYYR